jgi:hypothetical protein
VCVLCRSDGPLSDGTASDITTSTTRATVLFAPRPPTQPKSIASVERLRRSSVAGVGQSVTVSEAQVPTAAVGGELAAVGLSAAHQQQQQQQPLTVTECYDVIRKLRIDNSRQALEVRRACVRVHVSMCVRVRACVRACAPVFVKKCVETQSNSDVDTS